MSTLKTIYLYIVERRFYQWTNLSLRCVNIRGNTLTHHITCMPNTTHLCTRTPESLTELLHPASEQCFPAGSKPPLPFNSEIKISLAAESYNSIMSV